MFIEIFLYFAPGIHVLGKYLMRWRKVVYISMANMFCHCKKKKLANDLSMVEFFLTSNNAFTVFVFRII